MVGMQTAVTFEGGGLPQKSTEPGPFRRFVAAYPDAHDPDRGRRRLGARQPRPGRVGLVRRRRLLGQRRLGPRHQQHGRAHRGARPAAADRRRRRRPARLLRLHLRHQLDHQVDARLEAARLAEGRRQAGRQRGDHEGARRGDAGAAGAVRVGQGARRPRAERAGRRAGQRRGPGVPGRRARPSPVRDSAVERSTPRASGHRHAASRTPTCSRWSTSRSRPTRSWSYGWSGRC